MALTIDENVKKYMDSLNGVIGICELCYFFNDCAKEGELKKNGCDKHMTREEWESM